MKLNLKEWVNKVSQSENKPCVVAVNFQETLTSKTTGNKTASATIDVPDGYEVIPNCRPVSLYITGEATVSVTDRTAVSMNGTTASFNYYLYNPQSKTNNMIIACSILCRKVGGVVHKLLNTLKALTSERGWAV